MNLGVGIPTMVSNYLQGRDVILHAENGVLGYGADGDGGATRSIPTSTTPRASSLRSRPVRRSSTASPRSRWRAAAGYDTVILGAYEVDQTGSVANWSTADAKRGGIGGAMDLLSGKGDLIIVMEHTDSKGRPEAAQEMHLPADRTGLRELRGDRSLGAARWDGKRFVIDAVAPGFTPQEIIKMTEMEVVAGPAVRTMENA